MIKKYIYMGDPALVEHCQWHRNHKDNSVDEPCQNGNCPGKIQGVCCFYGGEPRGIHAELFARINEE